MIGVTNFDSQFWHKHRPESTKLRSATFVRHILDRSCSQSRRQLHSRLVLYVLLYSSILHHPSVSTQRSKLYDTEQQTLTVNSGTSTYQNRRNWEALPFSDKFLTGLALSLVDNCILGLCSMFYFTHQSYTTPQSQLNGLSSTIRSNKLWQSILAQAHTRIDETEKRCLFQTNSWQVLLSVSSTTAL